MAAGKTTRSGSRTTGNSPGTMLKVPRRGVRNALARGTLKAL